MLDQALRVVEAARRLGLERSGSLTRSSLAPGALSTAISGLLAEIERFDKDTGTGVPDPAHRPSFAFPPSETREEPMPEFGFEAEMSLDPEPEADVEKTPELPVPLPMPVMRRTAGPRDGSNADLGDDGAFFDGDESAADLLLAIDSINDKLAYAVGKVGWSPRLRALAEAARIAQNNMYIEVDGPEGWVRIPAFKFGTLSLAIAEAALDQDLTIALPKPRPRPEHEADRTLDHLPKPKPSFS